MKKIPWIIFGLMLLFAILYVTRTVPDLPPLVASHFDGAGRANAFMARSSYTKFVLGMSVGLPIAMVTLLTLVYSNARDMKLPNRDYWLAPERIAQTRATRQLRYLVRFDHGGHGLLRPLAGIGRASQRAAAAFQSIVRRRHDRISADHRRMDTGAAGRLSPAAEPLKPANGHAPSAESPSA
jgi:hypothetical protein